MKREITGDKEKEELDKKQKSDQNFVYQNIDEINFCFQIAEDPKERERLDFLNNKQVMADNDPIMRERAFKLLNNPNDAPTEKLREHYQNCQGKFLSPIFFFWRIFLNFSQNTERLDRLLRTQGDVTANEIPKGVQTFEQFCELAPEWRDPKKSHVFFRDDPKVKEKDVLAQRAQLSGLCYIHGPDMLQHYLVSMATEKAGMIDIAKLIRDTFSAQQLEDHIFKDDGGSSETMLKYILQPKSIVISTEVVLAEQRLKEFGPLLVARFMVHEDFMSTETHKHHGEPTGNKKGLHAMILIGTRTNDEGKKFFLLQNWWKAKQFIEIDEEYLKHSAATLYYVETPQLSIPETFTVDFARFAENENLLDKADRFPEVEGPIDGLYN